MSRRSFQQPTWTTVATADTATTLANGSHMSIGATAGPPVTGLNVVEIYVGGQATATAINIMQFARHAVVGASLTALAAPASDGPVKTLSAAAQSGSVSFIAATTPPQRSNTTTSARLNLTLNAFGGIVRWFANPGEEWGITGVSVNISESSLSAFTGSTAAALGSHIIYEVI